MAAVKFFLMTPISPAENFETEHAWFKILEGGRVDHYSANNKSWIEILSTLEEKPH